VHVYPPGVSEKTHQIDANDASILPITRTLQDRTILKNITPANVYISNDDNSATNSSPVIQDDKPSSSASPSFESKLCIKVHELYLDGEKLVTLQERLIIDVRTVEHLEVRMMDLIKRKSNRENVTRVNIFLYDTQVVDEMLTEDFFAAEGAGGFKCSVITNDEENGSFLAYLSMD